MPDFQPPEVDPYSLATLQANQPPAETEDANLDPLARRTLRRPVRHVPLTTMIAVAGVGRQQFQPTPRSHVLAWTAAVVVLGTAVALWTLVYKAPKQSAASAEPGRTSSLEAKNTPAPLPDVPREIVTALDLSRLAQVKEAAEKGDPLAQFSLGLAYAKGTGVPQDFAAAQKWYVKAALQHNANAQNNLGVMYVTGNGVPLDYVQGYKWFYLASRHIQGAVQNRNQVAMIMSAQQLAEALRQATAIAMK
jgi:hypothetical protein